MSQRIPVRYQDSILMPMRCAKARKLVKQNKAEVKKCNKTGIHYISLLFQPSGFNTQDMSLGVDPGSTFDGFSIVSNDTHHENIELIQRPKKGKTSIKTLMTRRATNRRTRRGRLRHRKVRYDNRTGSKLVPTIRANIEFRKWLITKLSKLYPINCVIIEDVCFNHYNDLAGSKWGKARGSSFSLVEIGKTNFYNWVINQGYFMKLIKGRQTKERRMELFNGVDLKEKEDKSKRSFFAHCLDSFALASFALDDIPRVIHKGVTFIEKVFSCRRMLHTFKNKVGTSKEYFRYGKNGVKKVFTKLSKGGIIRVKPNAEKSNHFEEWVYKVVEKVPCFKKFRSNYGGTIVNSKGSRNKNPLGTSKRALFALDGNLMGYKNQLIT